MTGTKVITSSLSAIAAQTQPFAELSKAASGASEVTLVQVQVLSWALQV